MNQLIRSAFTSLVLAAVWVAGPVYAQSAQKVMNVHIPFEFNVGGKTLPAGDYTIAQPLQDFLTLRNERGQIVAGAFAHPVQSSTTPAEAKLTFDHSGGQYSLAEIWQPEDGGLGEQLPAVKSRVSVAKKRAIQTESSGGAN